jgi:eukaryotic-like serine/threonine-protein kinase
MKRRGCLGTSLFLLLLAVAFGGSSYFWFTFFVRGKSVATPNLVGRSVTDARALASDVGLVLLVENSNDRHSDDVPSGSVVWQNRTAGNLVKRGTRLRVGQSLGPLVLEVPDLAGESERTAMLRFSQRNLKLGNLTYVGVQGEKGIIAADPPKGTVVKGQTPVSLLVGFPQNPPSIVMPDLIQRQLEQVRPFFERAGMNIATVRFETYPGLADGTIIRQFPIEGHPVDTKDAISLVVVRNEEAAFAAGQQ